MDHVNPGTNILIIGKPLLVRINKEYITIGCFHDFIYKSTPDRSSRYVSLCITFKELER